MTLTADPDLAAETFYGRLAASGGADQRLPLGRQYRTRFLNGGAAVMRTELVVWTEGVAPASPAMCDVPPLDDMIHARLQATLRDQGGRDLGGVSVRLDEGSVKLLLDADPLAVTAPFGQVDVGTVEECPLCGRPFSPPLQSWVVPVMTASGRFSVTLDALRLDGGCRP